MSRIDVPTLMCDRCKVTTQDRSDMGKFNKVQNPAGPGYQTETWDLCPRCWRQFQSWMTGWVKTSE